MNGNFLINISLQRRKFVIKLNRYVSTLKRNEGFTYVEVLFALLLLSSLLILFPTIINSFQNLNLPEDSFDIDIFILDIHDEINLTDKYDIKKSSEKELILKRNDVIVSYKFYDKRLIKSINNQGFITLMYDIEVFLITEKEETITLEIGVKDNRQKIIFKR